MDAEVKLFDGIMASDCHSGLRGWAITKMKDAVLRETAKAADVDFFKDKFRALCLRTFRLTAESDLLAASDEIMASTAFLWCLRLRDEHEEGFLGMKRILGELENSYVKELETGLKMTRNIEFSRRIRL